MVCPKCGSSELKVVEKRDVENEPIIRRRRECSDCNFRFTTYERLEVPSLTIVKKNGRREPYSREKLSGGIYRAIEKRPIDESTAEAMVAEIEKDLRSRGDNEVTSVVVGDMVMSKLIKLDEVAYLRFASVYKSFDSLDSFAEELKQIPRIKK
jgi:transcriptional repressor NrdR